MYRLICEVRKPEFFTQQLRKWNLTENKREMPWKGEKDPYKIWLSEIILQQTQVEQGWKYYEKFIKKYPTIQRLAKARDEEVFKMWEGLGYYNRCRNLLLTARYIAKERDGYFPATYEDILLLKGIGPYTAAALSSFAFNLPYAVVDGNVFRVLSRFFDVKTPIDSISGKNLFTKLAAKVLDKNDPGSYNQAIMDFGAIVCKPITPLCSICALQAKCAAFKKGIVNQLPVKEKLLQKKNRWFSYFLFVTDNKILISKRTKKDIWENLYEFFLIETPAKKIWDLNAVETFIGNQFAITNPTDIVISKLYSQKLTHQTIGGEFIKIILKEMLPISASHHWIDITKLNKYPFPKFINQYLQDASL